MTGSVTKAQECGPRSYQEDRYFCQEIKGEDYSGWLLAVMDGHGGSLLAEFCSQEIGNLFSLGKAEDSEGALRKLVYDLGSKTRHYHQGTTLSIACILESHDKVSVAVIGDSPVIVLDNDGKLHTSPEHNVRSNVQERIAAQNRGGVYDGKYLRTEDWKHGLQLSRALGDVYFEGIVSHEPEIYTISNPGWVLAASDGLVDPGHGDSKVLEEIEECARRRVDADFLMEQAKSRGLKDNVTALVWSAS